MCQYISATHVMPGYICCECKSYNGLQRSQLINGEYRTRCRFTESSGRPHRASGCALLIGTENIVQCAHCFAGYDKKEDGSPSMPAGNAAGKFFDKTKCCVCGYDFILRLPTTVNPGTAEAHNPC